MAGVLVRVNKLIRRFCKGQSAGLGLSSALLATGGGAPRAGANGDARFPRQALPTALVTHSLASTST